MKLTFATVVACLVLSFRIAWGQILPPSIGNMTFSISDSTAFCDYMLLNHMRFQIPFQYQPTSLIINAERELVWFREHNTWVIDFKLLPNGQYVYDEAYNWVVMDSNLAIQDTFRCVGLAADAHEFITLANGHVLLLCNEDSVMDLRTLYTIHGSPGDSAAVVTANIIQEQDQNHNVIKNWHSLDHFSIYEVDTLSFSNPARMELTHSNSLDMHPDGRRLILSNRALNDVVCIDWVTDSVLWRLGGVANDFNLVNDQGTSWQHDARWLPGERISIFDNATKVPPYLGRGLVYEIDTTAMTATKVLEFLDPSLSTDGMGSFQLLPDGKGLFNLGTVTSLSNVDVRMFNPDSALAWSMSLASNHYSYRAKCFDLNTQFPRAEITCAEVGGQAVLTVDGNPGTVMWTDGETTSSITATTLGDYQAFVPFGSGWVGSKVFHLTDLNNPCGLVSVPEPAEGRPNSKGKTQYFDVLGRQVETWAPGQVILEIGPQGRRKFVVFE